MTLTGLPLAAFLGGLALLAALLWWLQRLRVRHREVEVVTTLFWKEAVEETRARVRVQRFRHPWAYALILLAAGLVWLAIADPRFGGAGDREHVLVLDASAGMGFGTRFTDAARALRERAAGLPRTSTRVVLAGARVDTLLAPDEELALLDRRLAACAHEAVPASVERALPDLAATTRGAGGLAIEVFGDAPVSAAAVELLPDDVTVRRAELPPPARDGNAGVVALGVTEAASGAFDRVDLLVEVAGDRARDAAIAAVTLDGAPVPGLVAEVAAGNGGHVRYTARDLPARGGRVEVRVQGSDALAADDHAAIVLPDRPPVRVALAAGVPSSIADALAVDPGVTVADAAAADVVIRPSGDAFGGDLPALELTADDGGAAFVVRRPHVADAERELRASFELLGLGEIDSTELAQRAGRPIELTLEDADRPGIAVWASLFGDGFDFRQSRAFPLFLARAVRWLAGVEPVAFEVAAGSWVRDGSSRWTVDGRTVDVAGAELRVPRAGDAVDARGKRVHASLLDAAVTLPAASGVAAVPVGLEAAAGGGDVWPLVVLVAIALLGLEWWLVRKERMP